MSGNTDTSSLHASCPVLKGTKWTGVWVDGSGIRTLCCSHTLTRKWVRSNEVVKGRKNCRRLVRRMRVGKMRVGAGAGGIADL